MRSRDSQGPISLEVTYREGFAGRRPPAITYHLEIDELSGQPVVTREWMHWKRHTHEAPFRFLNYEHGRGEVIRGDVP